MFRAASVRRVTRLSAPAFAQAQYTPTDVGLLPGCTSATGTGVNAALTRDLTDDREFVIGRVEFRFRRQLRRRSTSGGGASGSW